MTEQEAMIRLDFIRCALLGGTKPEIIPNEDNVELMDNAIKALEDVKQYRAIGTVEECRAAMEKQKANKIVHVKLRQSEWGSEYRCPVCESDLIKTVFFNEDGTEPDKKISWCSGCGQKLDWSDEK